MLTATLPSPSHCRRAIVPACDPQVVATGTNPTAVNTAPLLVKVGDTIDIGLDWSQWIAGNGGKLKTSTWAAHAASPVAPTFAGAVTLIHESRMHTVAVLDLSAHAAGTVYYIENTVVIEGIADGTFTMPDRTLKRMLWVKLT
jgi:hypothetical protein